MTKTCSRCGEVKPLEDFYKNKRDLSGRSSACRACIKAKGSEPESRRSRREYQKSYRRDNKEKIRAAKLLVRKNNPSLCRKRARAEYQRNREGYLKRSRENDQARPDKRRARGAVERALKRGTLAREPCTVCGKQKVEGHHEDYSKPLNVIWLCPAHHKRLHAGLIEISMPSANRARVYS